MQMADSKLQVDCKEKDEQEDTNAMNHLPLEVAADIICRLPIKSIFQFRLACKSWTKLLSDPLIVSRHLSNALEKDLQCLIFHCSFPAQILLYFVNFPDLEDRLDTGKISQFEIPLASFMPRFKIVGSCNGILCLVRSWFYDDICVYNPFTRDFERLPKPTSFSKMKDAFLGFGLDPSTKQYKVIRVVYYQSTSLPRHMRSVSDMECSYVEICCLGINEWRSIGRTPYQLDRISTPVLLNGRIHWIAGRESYVDRFDRLITSFDLSDEVFREVPGPESLYLRRISRNNYTLAILVGCLSIAASLPPIHGCLDVWIMKEYGKKESWVKQFTIGHHFYTLEGTHMPCSYGVFMNGLDGGSLRLLCQLKSGKLLLGYRGESLVCYDPESGECNHIICLRLLNTFQTIPHVPSLNWIDASCS